MAKTGIYNMLSMSRKSKFILLASLFNSLFLSFLVYIQSNLPVFTGENLEYFSWIELLKSKIRGIEGNDSIQPLYVNVAFDKQLVDEIDEFGDTIGNNVITDRRKLLDFMRILRTSGNYRYIILDIRFEKGVNTELDSALFAEISSMDRIVVAKHRDMEDRAPLLLPKLALADYTTTILSTNFVRYEYVHDGMPSMPLYAFRELTGKDIIKRGLFYTCGGKLCYKSLFIHFTTDEDFERELNEDNIYKWENLGHDILNNKEYTSEKINGKCVVIGDFINDVHDTYVGKRPGPTINFYAFRALLNGEHFVSIPITLFFVLLYFLISIALFGDGLLEKLPVIRKSHSKILHFILHLMEYTVVLSSITIFLYLFYDVTVSILLPSLYFSIQKTIIQYKKYTL